MVQAFAELTHSEKIIVFGKIYYQNDLHRILCDELDSSTVIDAYDLFKNQYHSKGAKLLAWLILREHLTQEDWSVLCMNMILGEELRCISVRKNGSRVKTFIWCRMK